MAFLHEIKKCAILKTNPLKYQQKKVFFLFIYKIETIIEKNIRLARQFIGALKLMSIYFHIFYCI
ncbi:hypothetical protein PSECIP111951_03178 [Pseudoalteromonas holothuriae]|uniref:Uncharacterized protein n=1 Tax=Pseudoalteromonas holothuriae TaxID=2963714 RepID=A0A9W4VYH9_9GAMM|nr:hypothetical protein PSECIP111854_03295 [Pseudoalteromonas sp. CIP111854]CAH9064628.1 hypothetical protein PSECIP111951_03178 [Pseudoalteromonas sp. CIP111951]